MTELTPESAGEILAGLGETLDTCRRLLRAGPREVSLKPSLREARETVTDLDIEVERRLIARIHELQPAASVVSEETAPGAEAMDDDVCVVVDPIDGTDLLLAGEPGFAVSVAILARRRLVAGLLDFPARDQRFTCTRGGGTWWNGQRITLTAPRRLSEARVCVSSTQRAEAALRHLWENLEVAAVVPTPGFTAKIGTILTGECDAALSLPVDPRSTAIWDYAASALLLSEAGGALTTWSGTCLGDALPARYGDGWIAAAPDLAAALRAAVDARLPASGCER